MNLQLKNYFKNGFMEKNIKKPIIYSCSGCSSAAQMSNYLAVKMDRLGYAEMSCIAGVGGNIKNLVKTAKSGRNIIVIDGCPLSCAKACLLNHQINPTVHLELSTLGVKKKMHEDFDKSTADNVITPILLNQMNLLKINR